jgi:hypothetical protein
VTDELSCIRVGRASPYERLHIVGAETLLLEERLDYHQDVLSLSRLVGEVVAVTQEGDELLPILATLVALTSSNHHTANIHNQMVITSDNAKMATTINPRAKLPSKKNKKIFQNRLHSYNILLIFAS